MPVACRLAILRAFPLALGNLGLNGATLLRYWQPWVVPGIAQTRAYMLALFAVRVKR